jgi:branched-chain amino acid transport system permease protein
MRGRPWLAALGTGLLWGGVAVFVALAGMVEAFAERQIVAGVLSLSRALLALVALGAGWQAARGAAGAARALGRGALAGGAVGAAVVLLLGAGAALNLRVMLVNASPVLFSLLSFERGLAGAYLPLLGGLALGAVGGGAALLTGRVLKPLLAGLASVLVLGLFQEMFQLMLAEGWIQSAIREALFTPDALSARGAVAAFLLAAAISAGWAQAAPPAREAYGRLPSRVRRGLKALTLASALGVILGLPLVAGPFLSHVLVLVGLYVLMGLGLNLEVGYAGLLDLGFVAFFAIGAYTVGLLTSAGGHGIADLSFWAAVPIAVLVSLVAGVILGVPVLRIRGDYLAIATLGFGEIIRLLVLSDFLRPWLGGSQGVLGIPKPTIAGFELSGPQHLFYLTLASSALVAFVAARLRDSRLGRAWMALREDEDVAEAMGISLVNVKLLAYGLGAAFAGVSGAIFAVMVGSVFPHSFQLLISINVLALIIVGGMGSTPGVVVGALFLVGLPEMLREFSDFRFLVYGAALVLMMQLRPEGLWPVAAIRRELHAGEAGAGPRGAG